MDTSFREKGAFPVSIGTSLALESACGQHPDIQTSDIPILQYSEFWVNMKTLFRNYLGSLGEELRKAVNPKQIASDLTDEMSEIEKALVEKNPRIKVQFYLCDYNLNIRSKDVVVRTDKTPLQALFTVTYKETMAIILKTLKTNEDNRIAVFATKIKPKFRVTAMIMTHIAYDLLAYYDFEDLVLIESHTGTIKPKSKWYTKFYNGNDLEIIPFREDMLKIFGDKEIFAPMPKAMREEVLTIAKADRWSQLTTKDKILHSLAKMKNRYVAEIIKSAIV